MYRDSLKLGESKLHKIKQSMYQKYLGHDVTINVHKLVRACKSAVNLNRNRKLSNNYRSCE